MRRIFLLANLCLVFGLTAPRILFAESGLIFDQTQGMLTGQLNVSSNIAAAGSVTASSATLANTAGAGLTVSSSAYLAVSGGNVGIGTTAPRALFQVGGGTLTATAGGKVGIGTAGPANILHVSGTVEDNLVRLHNNSATFNETSLRFRAQSPASENSHADFGFKATGLDAGRFFFKAPYYSAERMVIDTAGNVGIGTTTPLYQLHIKGPTAYIAFQDTDDPNGSIGTITSYQSATMYYDANANNSATTGGGHIFRADGAGKTLVTFLNNGNAGIGTISPLKRLDVRGTDSLNATLALTNGWGGAYILMGNQDSGGVNNPSMIMAANGNLQFGGGTNWSDNVGGTFDPGITLLDSGNVGIGTVSPGTKLEINGTAAIGKTYHNILTIGPLGTSPDYFYIDTKIPFTDTPAPQIHITGYNYANTNKAVKVTLSWYEYSNIFNWAQYKSDLGYYNPSRIRLGTYDDAGTARVRIEIANDSTYWSSYFISATDANGAAASYNGWSYTLGEMPAGTGNVTVVSEYSGIVYSNAGRVGIGTTAPTVQFERVCPAGFTNVKAVNNQLGCIQTAENGTATYYNAIRACFTSYGGRLPFSQEFGIAYANFSLTNANNGWEWAGDTAWYGSVVSASVVDGAAISIDACSASYPYRCWIPR